MNLPRTTKRSSKQVIVKDKNNVGKSSKKKYRCRECMKSYASRQSLREHKYSHTNEKPYVCLVCGKSFKFGSQLCIHRKSHVEFEDFVYLKLTDLLPESRMEESTVLILQELVRLPPIRCSQSFSLPKLSEFLE